MHQHEDYFSDDKQLSRKERKRLSAKDRSKYKKTDRKKMTDGPLKEGLLVGRVLSITAQGFLVDNEGKNYVCTLRGVLKKERSQEKNLVAVGDLVHFEEIGDKEGVIEWIEPRKSLLYRAEKLSRHKRHILAANIDQVLITASVSEPTLKPSLLDRYVIAAKKGRLTPVIVINKCDLITEESREFFQKVIAAYKKIGIEILLVSAQAKEGIDELKEVMRGKASVFSGQSGVGKSSLINEVAGLVLETRKTVKRTGKGAHTTTTAELLPLDCGGFVIDTPGVQSFGLWNLSEEEIRDYYTEIQALSHKCRYLNCTHSHEPECAVIRAVEKGKISEVRYDSYLALIYELDQEHKRR